MKEKIPVTLLSGNLGAGKTTVLNHILNTENERDIAVILNDMGEINIDAEKVAETSNISEEEKEMIELSNGCICCELRGDLLDAIGTLAKEKNFDQLIIESTGVAEPLPVAQTLTLGFGETSIDPTEFHKETGFEPQEVYQLDTTVTVIDAHRFKQTFQSEDVLEDGDTDKPIAELLIDQIEFYDVLLLNKCDLVTPDEIKEIEAAIRKLQPKAEIIRTVDGEVEPERVLKTGKFNLQEAANSAGWIKELREPHKNHEEEHGISSFNFNSKKPFHPERFGDWLNENDHNILRAKGEFWLTGRDKLALELSQAGESIRVSVSGHWIASLPEKQQEEYFEKYPDLKEDWHKKHGDKATQLVFIGTELDEEKVVEELEKCVLTEKEMEKDLKFEDPFPEFKTRKEQEEIGIEK